MQAMFLIDGGAMSAVQCTAKRVLVTGGAVRIGQAIVRVFAAAGYRVVIHYRQSESAALALHAELGGDAAGHTVVQADLLDQSQVDGLLPAVTGAGGPIDVLVNSAAVYSRRPLSETDAQRLADAYAVNFIAPFLLMRSFATVCRKGAIINLLDQRVAQADFRAGAYGLAKKSLRDATEAAALEWAPRIRVNGVAPGLVAPPPGVPPEKMSPLLARVPTQRAVTMEEVARACLFLAQMEAITGQTLYLDGGLHLLGPNAAGEK